MCFIKALCYCIAFCIQDLAFPSLSEDNIQEASQSLLHTPVSNVLGKLTES